MCYDRTIVTHQDYRQATALLWGPAGEYAADEFARLNRYHFAGSIPPMPVIIGLVPFGVCIGATRGHGGPGALRITLAPELFNGNHRTPGGPRMVSDVLLHEMAHAFLILRGEDPSHNGGPWCQMITDISPGVLGHEITARPVLPRRIPNPAHETDPKAPKTIVARRAEPGALTQAELATWPHCRRPEGYYRGGEPIPVPTY
jgi:hypothetical protein